VIACNNLDALLSEGYHHHILLCVQSFDLIWDFSWRSLFIYNLKVTLTMENEAERLYEALLCVYNYNAVHIQKYPKGTLVPCESYHGLERRGGGWYVDQEHIF